MTEIVVEQPGGLSEVSRVVNTFVAPAKTFTDIRRKATWWLPFCIMIVVGLFFATSIDRKVGFDAVAQKSIEQSPMLSDRVASMPAADRTRMLNRQATTTKYTTYGYSAIILLWGLMVALLYWMTMNFVMGASIKFKQALAVWMYGALPGSLKAGLAACLLWANVGTEGFDIKNPVGTNPAYYLPDANAALKAALGFFDVFGLWTLALMVIGLAAISGKTKGQAAVVAVGWWVFGLLLATALGAMFG